MNESNQNIFLHRFLDFFREKNLLPEHLHFLVAVSGGIDSVVLCAFCREAGISFTIAHCNFGLRGGESERDESFVRELGNQYGVEVLVKKFDTEHFAEEEKISIQEAARNIRYEWFEQIRKEKGFAYILTAHQGDDNIETLLMHLFRGTGLQGLTAIPDWNQNTHVLRPLLRFRRTELEAYANQSNIKWVEDSSNASLKYTRNFFRNELIPAIRKVYPQTEENLLSNIERFKKINLLYQLSVDQLKKKICERRGDEIWIPVKKLMSYKNTSLIYEIIKDFGFGERQVEEMIKLAGSSSGKYFKNEKWQIIRHGKWYVVAPVSSSQNMVLIEADMEKISFHSGHLELKTITKEKFQLVKEQSRAQLDAKYIQYPLLLRKWKQGDYFYPLGMRKKKKIARFLIDQKMPKQQKENVWVIESNKKIIWVVGLRIDDRMKITDTTRSVILITYQH